MQLVHQLLYTRTHAHIMHLYDRSVNLADQDQVLAPKGDTLGRRKEEVDNLALRCRNHRAVLREGVQVRDQWVDKEKVCVVFGEKGMARVGSHGSCLLQQVEVLEILPPSLSSSSSSPRHAASATTADDAQSAPPPPRKPQFLPVKMQVDGLNPSPPPANEAGPANDDLLRARCASFYRK